MGGSPTWWIWIVCLVLFFYRRPSFPYWNTVGGEMGATWFFNIWLIGYSIINLSIVQTEIKWMNREHWHLSIRQLFCFAKSNEESKSSKCRPTTAKQASTATTTIKVHYSETKIQTAKPSGPNRWEEQVQVRERWHRHKENDIILSYYQWTI